MLPPCTGDFLRVFHEANQDVFAHRGMPPFAFPKRVASVKVFCQHVNLNIRAPVRAHSLRGNFEFLVPMNGDVLTANLFKNRSHVLRKVGRDALLIDEIGVPRFDETPIR